jgi:virginiamycin A acetyltransferase
MKMRRPLFKLKHTLYRQIKRVKGGVYRYRNNIHVAKNTYLGGGVKLGRGTRINHPSHIENCTIGAYCAIAGRLIVRSSNHFVNYLNMQDWVQSNVIESSVFVSGKSKGRITIGNNVWIGDSVIILTGVTIGDGSIIGAGSVVVKSIPSYSIAAGNPCKIIRSRFSPEIIELISKIDWWNWSDKKLKVNKFLFEINFDEVSASELKNQLSKIKS